MAYDRSRDVMVVFGGVSVGSTGLIYNRETWEWNGTSWTLRSTVGPSFRGDFGMAYDPICHVTVLFGGYNDTTGLVMGDTWVWNGTTWMQPPISGPSPLARGGSTMEFDQARGVAVLFGGYDAAGLRFGDTWTWNGTAWTLVSTNGPSPRSQHSMTFDAACGVIVLFGGNLSFGQSPVLNNETWEWNGTTWAARTVLGPSARQGQKMAYDAAHMATILFGGMTSGGVPNAETWGLEPVCGSADFNHSGTLSVQDIFDFLSAWFALDPRADFNGVGGITTQDIFDFLAAWFTGCG